MKILLLTVHKVTNYGAILQAFATKSVLERYGEVFVLDYQNRYLTSHLNILRFKASLRGIKMLAHDLLNFPGRSVMVRKFKSFISGNFNLTTKLDAAQLEMGEAGKYDVYICGSDQIWNPDIISPSNSIDPIYFLSFAGSGNRKVSFASSMGNYEFSDQESNVVRSLLSGFHRISVREKEGKQYLQSLFPDRPVSQVIDPTLLLTGADWQSILKLPPKSPEDDYILVYSVPRTKLLRKAIKFYASKFGMRVVAIDKMLVSMGSVDRHIRTAGPAEFISLYANARFVITDSFHGTCFSVNFEKPFVCIPATARANRQEGLLSALGLSDRIVYREEEFARITPELDYNVASTKMAELRAASLEFLAEALKP